MITLSALGAAALYRQALQAADTAYDRTLLASAKSIGERLDVEVRDGVATLVAPIPYSALEAFEADNRSRMLFRVSGFDGRTVAGYDDLPDWHGSIPAQGAYAALVEFYDAVYRGDPVRMAVLLQPVAAAGRHGMATIQVAETLELRRTLARRILVSTLWRQAVLLALIALVVVAAVHWATRPVREASERLRLRPESDLSPVDSRGAPRELLPLLDAIDQLMSRLAALLAHRQRFIRDAAHQLRTPLAVLKTQTQSALRGDVGPMLALQRDRRHRRARHRAGRRHARAGPRRAAAAAGRRARARLGAAGTRGGARPGAAGRRAGARFRAREPSRRRCARMNGRCANWCATCCTTRCGTARRAGRCR